VSAVLFNRDVGKLPISSDRPAGESPRDGEAFTALKAQIDQLTDIHSNATVDWAAVVSLGTQVLGSEGKDLAAGVWLTAGLLETANLRGLADGIHVVRDLVETYWDDMTPPAARLRGRRNQMQWLLDHLGDRLQPNREGDTPLPADVHAAMLEDWEALDAAWQGHDDEAPAFYGLRSTLRGLPVEAEPEPAAPAAPAAQDQAAPAAAAPAAVAAPAPAPQAVAAPPSAAVAIAPPAAATAVAPAAGADPEAAAEAALAGLHPLIDWYLQTQPTLPLLFRINRICAWTTLDSLPPARGGTTLLMPPPMQIVDNFRQIAQTGEPQAVIQFAESYLGTHRYWLDLNRASHAALTRMGAADAAAAVALETARFLERLSGVEELKFSDGQPFADAETRAWLDGLGGAGNRPNGGRDNDELASLATAAEADAAAGKLDEALERLQQAARRSEGQRARFRLRLAQCALLHRFDGRADIRPLLAPLIEELDAHRLPSWEPELARQALALAAAVELRYGADDAGSSNALLARLASVDCRAAWQLSQSTAAA
jgi:type VI secretion system protein VasJ